MPLIQIHLLEGRSRDEKRRLLGVVLLLHERRHLAEQLLEVH